MTDYSDFYGGRFLKSEDVIGKPFAGVIASVKPEKMQDGRMRVVVFFEGHDKGVVLNATRHRYVVTHAKSKNSDDWIGLKIGVRAGVTNFGGKEVGCIEFTPPPKSAKAKKAEVVAELNDEIPWE